MSIRMAREVDKAVNVLSNDDLDFLLEHLGVHELAHVGDDCRQFGTRGFLPLIV